MQKLDFSPVLNLKFNCEFAGQGSRVHRHNRGCQQHLGATAQFVWQGQTNWANDDFTG